MVYFSIIAFFAVIILTACGVALADIFISIWGFAASWFSSSSSQVKAWWDSPPVRLFRLGGVTTLRQKLNEPCAMCQDSMEPGEKVRTLSCNHVFHYGATVKCQKTLDEWLLKEDMSCPICRGIPHPVLPWKRPPPSLLMSEEEEEEEVVEQEEEEEEEVVEQEEEVEVEEEVLLPTHWFDETLLQESPSQ